MVDSFDDFLYNHVINTSSNESDDDSEILKVVTLLVHEHEKNQVQRYRAQSRGEPQ
jgi:hypothetical protein